ncbi:hypothetical protein TanjilG_00223, partial [Lupinus angustifolius]
EVAFEYKTYEEKPKWLEHNYFGVLSENLECNNPKGEHFLDCFFSIRVSPLGCRTVLLRADEEGELEELLKEERVWFGKCFELIRRWEPSDVATDRYIWLQCYGIPLNSWEEILFRNISNQLDS